MSWSIAVIGKPEAVCDKLSRHGETLWGQSALEFEAARPHLQELVRQNFATKPPWTEPVIHLRASGSGGVDSTGDQVHRTCAVSIETFHTELV